jgi:hypothetical protein
MVKKVTSALLRVVRGTDYMLNKKKQLLKLYWSLFTCVGAHTCTHASFQLGLDMTLLHT